MNQLKRFQYPRFARRWIRMSAGLERRGLAGLREQTVTGLAGRVIEIGCGNGLNFRHYPADVDEVIAVEPTRRCDRPPNALRTPHRCPCQWLPVTPMIFPVPTGPITLRCSPWCCARCRILLPRWPRSAGRCVRVGSCGSSSTCGPGTASGPQDLISPISAKLDAGCRQGRDTSASIEDAGFAVSDLERFSFADLPLVPGQPMIRGTAVLPGESPA